MPKKKLVIIGNTKNCDIGSALLESEIYDIVGGIIDSKESESTQQIHRAFLKENNIAELEWETLLAQKPDMAIIITYSKVIPKKYLEALPILNIHGGLLPKYKGSNCSCWAILNGEKEVGYTLHKIDEGLDTGPIYYRFVVPISAEQKFGDVHAKIRKQVCDKIKGLVEDILLDKLKPQSQEGEPYIYTTPLRKEDGKIKWTDTSDYIYNLYRVFGAPYGSGIYFSYKDKVYEATKISKVPNIIQYIGACGGVVNVKNHSIWVKTGDTLISIDEIKKDDQLFAPSSIFKIGNRLS